MELIPILAILILAATISTFVLAISAYVLFKIRERQESMKASKTPEIIEGEIIAPKGVVIPDPKGTYTPLRKTYNDGIKYGKTSNESRSLLREKVTQKKDISHSTKSTTPPIKKPPIFESGSFNPRKILSKEFTEGAI